jgi:hypothetical protein
MRSRSPVLVSPLAPGLGTCGGSPVSCRITPEGESGKDARPMGAAADHGDVGKVVAGERSLRTEFVSQS